MSDKAKLRELQRQQQADRMAFLSGFMQAVSAPSIIEVDVPNNQPIATALFLCAYCDTPRRVVDTRCSSCGAYEIKKKAVGYIDSTGKWQSYD